MKTKIEMSGYEIEIELHEDSISVKAEKDGEVVEEMSLPLEEGMESEEEEEDMEEDGVKSFSDFDEKEEDMEEEEEEDFEELPEGEEDMEEENMEEEEEDMEEEEGKLESFQSYLKRSQKKVKKNKLVKEELDVDSQSVEMLASIIGALALGAGSYGVAKAMDALKSGKAGELGKKIADKLEQAGGAAGDAVRSGESKGKWE